jgi:hypothetical protein
VLGLGDRVFRRAGLTHRYECRCTSCSAYVMADQSLCDVTAQESKSKCGVAFESGKKCVAGLTPQVGLLRFEAPLFVFGASVYVKRHGGLG